MLISVVLPPVDGAAIAAAAAHLSRQSGEWEMVAINPPGLPDLPAAVVPVQTTAVSPAEQLNAAALAARGDVLLFLPPGLQLPGSAFSAIAQNFRLLPQTVGGSFHLHFSPEPFFARMTTRLVKWNRYRGRYGLESGLFVRREIFAHLGGFNPRPRAFDVEFTRRLEQAGPTLYLPQAVTMPWPGVLPGLRLLFGGTAINRQPPAGTVS
ncbi:MAG: hypothetical protein D6784_12440 [Chloroflexi bacterium]|nr:MAG: hypothetical protein D6784_12440 [Chloroflexota bacterium]